MKPRPSSLSETRAAAAKLSQPVVADGKLFVAETDAEASDVIQLTYQSAEVACTNCPGNLDFATAHKQWEEARDAMPGRCPAFADSPAQSISPKN